MVLRVVKYHCIKNMPNQPNASTASNETRFRVVDFSLISYGPPTIATRHDQE